MKKDCSICQLEFYGFKKVGEWKLHNERVPIKFEIEEGYMDKTELIYAFTTGDAVKYIGVTTKSLSERMNGYMYGKEVDDGTDTKKQATTNKKLHKYIVTQLNAGNSTFIYVIVDQNLGFYKGLRISPVTGIEHSLINFFKDGGDLLNERAINTSKKNKSRKDTQGSNGREFRLRLGKEYYTRGKIGFRKPSDSFLPQTSGVKVEIKLWNENEPIEGTFTRSGTTLAINGKEKLIQWYSRNFGLDDEVGVRIKDETHFELF